MLNPDCATDQDTLNPKFNKGTLYPANNFESGGFYCVNGFFNESANLFGVLSQPRTLPFLKLDIAFV